MSNEKGLSKKQQKKLAKKAEKDAKKQGEEGKPAPDGKPFKDTAAAFPPQPEPPVLRLTNTDDSPSTWKALWASQLCQVDMKPSRGKSSFPLAHGPSLQYGNEHVMGGNCMAKAVCMYSGNAVSAEVDEWCEWERTKLRHSPIKALPHLETALLACGGHHLVNHTTTVADICVVSALASLSSCQELSPVIQAYMQCHESALTSAQGLMGAFERNPLDLDNPSLETVVNHVFSTVLYNLFGDDLVDKIGPNIVGRCSNPKHGDFQCTAAMPLFAAMNKSGTLPTSGMKSPQDVAKAIVDALDGTDNPVVEHLEINGPGFVLCRITASYLQKHANLYIQQGHLPKPLDYPKETCLVDFSSPNIAKEMHVGHLRSTILGEAICRILESVGCKVHRVNHVGDWGTQFGMLIQYLKEEYPNFTMSSPNITDLTEFYKSAKRRFDEDETFKEASRINVVKLQSGDEDCLKVWQLLCDVSRVEFQKVYDRLDVTVEECGESFYNDKIPAVLDEFEKAGILTVDDGAKVIWVDGYTQIPLIVQKSDGGFGYDSTDMAALKYRLQELKATRIIAVTDVGQSGHFELCYGAAGMIGWLKDGQKLEHIGFGTVNGEDGKRFKTRSGETVRLVDLLDEAVRRMEASLKERIAEDKANITLDEVHKVAEAIGYGAVKYFDLSRNPTSNYQFSYDRMLDTKGNTAVYLLYANARLESICTKAKVDYNVDVDELVASKTEIVISHPSERNLVLQMQMFTDTLAQTLQDLYPYHICEYVYNLSIAASDFVTQCKVLGSPEMNSRLLLCRATTMAMRECFDLLAIRHVDRI